MIVAGQYSFNGGQEVIERHYAAQLSEIMEVIAEVDGAPHRTKVSTEKTMPGRLLYNPSSLNSAYKHAFETRAWSSKRLRVFVRPQKP